jgi:hypothetical protein
MGGKNKWAEDTTQNTAYLENKKISNRRITVFRAAGTLGDEQSQVFSTIQIGKLGSKMVTTICLRPHSISVALPYVRDVQPQEVHLQQ